MITLVVFQLFTEHLPVLLESFALCEREVIILKQEVIILKREVVVLRYLVNFGFKFKFKLSGFS